MAFDRNQMLFQWFGSITAGGDSGEIIEDFSGSIRFAAPDVPSNISDAEVSIVDNGAAGEQVARKLQAFWVNPTSRIPRNYMIQTWKWNRLGRDGKYMGDETRLEGFTGPRRGGVGLAYPTFIALVATYRTGATRGLAKAGRTYWPTGIAIDSDRGQTYEDQRLVITTNLANMLADMGNWDGLDTTAVQPVIMSKQRDGKTRGIKSVSIGNQLDVMTSRKIAPERYSSVNL